MKNVINIIKILVELTSLLPYIIEFLNALKAIKKESGNEVAEQIAKDAATIGNNWIDYLNNRKEVKHEEVK